MARMRAWIRWTCLVLVVVGLMVVPRPVDALCGDCAVIYDRPECVSPPPTYISCFFYREVEFWVVGATIIRVEFIRCEGTVECTY